VEYGDYDVRSRGIAELKRIGRLTMKARIVGKLGWAGALRVLSKKLFWRNADCGESYFRTNAATARYSSGLFKAHFPTWMKLRNTKE
jgi:hypothetical protein